MKKCQAKGNLSLTIFISALLEIQIFQTQYLTHYQNLKEIHCDFLTNHHQNQSLQEFLVCQYLQRKNVQILIRDLI